MAMYFLRRLIIEKKTVVYQNVENSTSWIFRADGTATKVATLDILYIPELSKDGGEVYHIFDAKAKGGQPSSSNAFLVEFSSTNPDNYVQTIRRPFTKVFLCPSITPDEYKRYARMLNMPETPSVPGLGMNTIREILDPDYKSKVSIAVSDFNIDLLIKYATLDKSPSSVHTPSILLHASAMDMNVDMVESVSNSRSTIYSNLMQKYAWKNSKWGICDPYMELLCAKYSSNARIVIDKFREAFGTTYPSIISVFAAKLAEAAIPSAIKQNGLTVSDQNNNT